MNRISSLKKSRFAEYIVRENALDKQGFKEWVFYPGMLFNAVEKWWGALGKRKTPHEGLDLCLFRNVKDEILRLDETTKVPAMYDGIVVKIIDDFLGKSVVVEHTLTDREKFCTIFAHVIPFNDIRPGVIVKEGDVIATIAGTVRSKSGILPHLHISAGRLSEHASYEQLDWESLGTSKTLVLFDPLKFIDSINRGQGLGYRV